MILVKDNIVLISISFGKKGNNMEKDILLTRLKQFDSEKDPLYTIKLKELVINCTISELKKIYLPIVNKKGKYNKNVRFAAYYSIFIFYRRYEHHTMLYNLVERFSDEFNEYRLNNVVLSQYYKYKFLDVNDSFAIENAIQYAKVAVADLNENSGVLQNYAELVACALETDKDIGKQNLEEAIKCIDKAMILLHDYPKHNCTKGRLLSWTGDYDTAKRYLRRAIDLESSDDKDSMIRISQYNDYYMDIKTREMVEKVSRHIVEAEKTMDENNVKMKENAEKIFEKLDIMQTKYLEMLAFFSGIIALILSVIQIMSGFSDFSFAVGLIMVMGGILIFSFGFFRCLFTYHNNKISWKIYFCIFFFSFTLISLGYYIGNYNFGG